MSTASASFQKCSLSSEICRLDATINMQETRRVQLIRAAYAADRAAALAGVPLSTVHYWARTELLVPTVSAVKVKLWSYSDVVALRIIGWLRQDKKLPDGREVPSTPIPTVRRAIKALRELEIDVWSEERGPTLFIDRRGALYWSKDGVVSTVPMRRAGEQVVETEVLDLMAPFELVKGQRGPDLRQPRPMLRIIPGKLAGSPHIVNTRIETVALGALAARGMGQDTIAELYPSVEASAIRDALDLEGQLAQNLAA
jgi:uncharacterized protein (DUF433 family)